MLFGEPMPYAAVQEAFALAREADVVLVVGSSLVVYPAADITLATARSGAHTIVINAEATPFDELAEVVIHGKAGQVCPRSWSSYMSDASKAHWAAVDDELTVRTYVLRQSLDDASWLLDTHAAAQRVRQLAPARENLVR